MTERTNAEIAKEAIAIILKRREARMAAAGPDDPNLDEVVRVIHEGLKRPGFFSALMQHGNAAGLEMPAKDLAALLIDIARRH